MSFQKGTWVPLPSNCSRDYTLTYSRCAEYGVLLFLNCISWVANVTVQCAQWAWQAEQQCVSWAQQTAQQCTNWAQQTSQQCCNWWPCSWLCSALMTVISWVCTAFAVIVTVVCVAFAVVVTLVCLVFSLIVTLVCAVAALIVFTFCLLWSVVSIIFCISNMNGGTAFLLTDGTVMIQECQSILSQFFPEASWGTRRWWKLTPDAFGSYANGTWSRLADSNVGRLYYASAVLADGRVLVCGGEWTDTSGFVQQDEVNSCEIYDPVQNSWTVVASPTAGTPPVAWDHVGDAPCVVLPDGKFLVGSNESSNVAELDPSTLAWTAMNTRSTSSSSEESWVLMPDNTVAAPSCISPNTTWVYDIATDTWNPGNPLPQDIVNTVQEVGPALLRYDGTAFFFGANQHTAIFTPAASPSWSNGGDLPPQNGQNIGIVDGPAALLVNGNVLFGAGPTDTAGDFIAPSMYFEFDGTTFNRTDDPPNNGCPTNKSRLLLLPDGSVLFAREDDSSFFAYQPAAAVPQDAFRPVIQNCPTSLVPGSTIQISGLQFNGLSQAVAYGDDCQNATNYPLVKVVNLGSGHVTFCRTFNHTTPDSNGNPVPSMGVATGAAVITTNVAIPPTLESGKSSLFVIANGIPSQAFAVTVRER